MIKAGSSALVFTGSKLEETLFDGFPEVLDSFPGGRLRGNDDFQMGELVLDLQDLLDVGGVGDDRFGLAVAQAVFQCIRPEKREEGNGDAANFINGDMGKSRLRALGEENPDPVAAFYAVRSQRVCQPVGKPLQVPESELLDFAFLIFVDQRQPVSFLGPFIADVDPDVVVFGNRPPEAAVNLLVGAMSFQHD